MENNLTKDSKEIMAKSNPAILFLQKIPLEPEDAIRELKKGEFVLKLFNEEVWVFLPKVTTRLLTQPEIIQLAVDYFGQQARNSIFSRNCRHEHSFVFAVPLLSWIDFKGRLWQFKNAVDELIQKKRMARLDLIRLNFSKKGRRQICKAHQE